VVAVALVPWADLATVAGLGAVASLAGLAAVASVAGTDVAAPVAGFGAAASVAGLDASAAVVASGAAASVFGGFSRTTCPKTTTSPQPVSVASARISAVKSRIMTRRLRLPAHSAVRVRRRAIGADGPHGRATADVSATFNEGP
jgi:hypothetical protein